MSADIQQLKTAVIISPYEISTEAEYQHLPLHINVVDPFMTSPIKTDRFIRNLAPTLLRNIFEITGFEHRDRGIERIQRLGGSVLHHLHDEIIGTLDRLRIEHNNVGWTDGTDQTWYSGTWSVPENRVKIKQVHVAQEESETQLWHILSSTDLKVSNDDFRQDELYLDSVINPVHKRRTA